MSEKNPAKPSKKSALSQALRTNLAKRKAQARARTTEDRRPKAEGADFEPQNEAFHPVLSNVKHPS